MIKTTKQIREKHIASQLPKIMEKKKLYLNPKLSIVDLAVALDTNKTYLSDYDGKSNIAPYRAFIQVNGTRATRTIQSWFEDVDGTAGATVLKTIDFDGKERYYDLNGRQLNGAQKHGVHIHNGKKVVGY